MATEVAEKRRRLTREDGGQAYGLRGPEDPEEARLTAEQRQQLRLSLGKPGALRAFEREVEGWWILITIYNCSSIAILLLLLHVIFYYFEYILYR